MMSEECCDPALYGDFVGAGDSIEAAFEAREYGKAIREIMALADRANQYIDEQQPWVLAKRSDQAHLVQQICSLGINLFRLLMVYLQPVIPLTARKTAQFLNIESLEWEQRKTPLRNHCIRPYSALLTRIEQNTIEAMMQATEAELNTAQEPLTGSEPSDSAASNSDIAAICDPIDYEDFAKIDMRIGRIIEAEAVSGADKLVRLKIDIGNETRTILAGIKQAYQAESLIGRLTVVVANLKPRKMRFGVSQGMVLAAGPGGKELWLLEPDSGARPGMRVK